jgi:hypothetical protein
MASTSSFKFNHSHLTLDGGPIELFQLLQLGRQLLPGLLQFAVLSFQFLVRVDEFFALRIHSLQNAVVLSGCLADF